MANTKNIFISHVHEDDHGCDKLKQLLKKNGMQARDYSITKENPNQAKSDDYIENHILVPQIKQCSTLVVYLTKNTKGSEWVEWEVNRAEKEGKRVVAVYAYGEGECEVPKYIDDLANAIVGWNGKSIISAINGKNTFEKKDGSPYRKNERRTIATHTC